MTLTGDPLVIVSKTLYLIFKFAVALWQPYDDDIRSVRCVESTLKKQTLTKLEFVLGHNDDDCITKLDGRIFSRVI